MTSYSLPKKFNGRVPIILNHGKEDKLELQKGSFLVKKETTLGQFMFMIRQKNKIKPTEAIYVFCNNILPKSTSTMVELWYEYHNDEDDILHLTCSRENTFG